MAASPRMTREEEYLISEDPFRRNAFWIINEMLDMSPANRSVLVDEVLHSIFFLGEINNPKHSPETILDDKDILNKLKGRYPEPFKLFSSQLPKRSPFSCVLDMVVKLKKQQNEDQIKNRLREFINEKLSGNQLVSNTICVSQKNTAQDSVRLYGVSMSTSGRDAGRIVVAASCLSNWDSYVADAVMTYYPEKQKKTYFDGTIKLPKQVRCEAFSLSSGAHMDPCRSCGNMFGLETTVQQQWAYGNCAEAESLSNLLKNEKEMRKHVKQPSDKCTPANRQRAVENVKKLLKQYLPKQYTERKIEFYTPQGN